MVHYKQVMSTTNTGGYTVTDQRISAFSCVNCGVYNQTISCIKNGYPGVMRHIEPCLCLISSKEQLALNTQPVFMVPITPTTLSFGSSNIF